MQNISTDLFAAIDDGDVARVRTLLKVTPSLMTRTDEYGSTPLMRAVSAMDRNLEVIKALVAAGADVNAKTEEGYTALHMMIDVNGPSGSGDLPGKIARLLVDAGAEVEVRQHWGWTPLMRAVVEGTTDELQALVDVGGDVNNVFPDDTLPEFLGGRTTLMAAIADPAKTRILIDAGANPAVTDSYGQTVLEYATECLAEEANEGTDMRQITEELTDTTMSEMLQQMEEVGIDPDAPVGDTGKTYRQTAEDTLRNTFEKSNEFDYAKSVSQSMAIIERALAGE